MPSLLRNTIIIGAIAMVLASCTTSDSDSCGQQALYLVDDPVVYDVLDGEISTLYTAQVTGNDEGSFTIAITKDGQVDPITISMSGCVYHVSRSMDWAEHLIISTHAALFPELSIKGDDGISNPVGMSTSLPDSLCENIEENPDSPVTLSCTRTSTEVDSVIEEYWLETYDRDYAFNSIKLIRYEQFINGALVRRMVVDENL